MKAFQPNLFSLLYDRLKHIKSVLFHIMSWLRQKCYNVIGRKLLPGTSCLLTDLCVLYKNEHFVVLNKCPDIKVNSDDPRDGVTVETQLKHRYPHDVDRNTCHSFRFAHRLDYATSGAICIALTKQGAKWANKAFRNRYVSKHYLALVRGHLSQEIESPIVVEEPIGQDASVTDIYKMCTPANSACKAPRNAKTSIVLLEHGFYDEEPASKVLLIPHTGRTHQLRVHCDFLGHRIVGDYMYSNRSDSLPFRMMLHAYRLVIPMKYEHIDVTAPDPLLPDVCPKWKSTETFTTYSKEASKYIHVYEEK